MRVRREGIFKMHSEDDDNNLPIAFQQRRHEQRIENVLADVKAWRTKSQKERVSCCEASRLSLFGVSLLTDENGVGGLGDVLERWSGSPRSRQDRSLFSA